MRALFLTFSFFILRQGTAFAIIFPDDGLRFLENSARANYPSSTARLAMTVGRIYSPRGSPVGTGIHVGSGRILIAYHLYADFLADAQIKRLSYSLLFQGYPTENSSFQLFRDDTPIEHRFCDPVWDFCIFEVTDALQKAKMANRHVFISTRKPTVNSDVITAGFPGGFAFDDPRASEGIMVDEERSTFAEATERLPRRRLPSYPFTVSGDKGISNSPVSLKNDPLLMAAYFWGVPRDHRLEKTEAIRRYRDGIAQNKDLNEVDFLLNWGIGADHIAESLLHSPLRNLFCSGGNDRIYACR